MPIIKVVDRPIKQNKKVRIGISGTGFISIGLFNLIERSADFSVSQILTKRPISDFAGQRYASVMTQDITKLVDTCDVIVECTGDPIWASQVVQEAFEAKRPVVTMNSELQIIAGSYFRTKGVLCESEGDQPGSIAVLDREIRLMGFKPCIYGSQKSYLDPNPSLESMLYWSKRNRQSLDKTTSFTDGTKIQIESALIANGLGTDILKEGLLGPENDSTKKGALDLANQAQQSGRVVTDYVVNPNGRGEIFVVATHDQEQMPSLAYYKLGDEPLYFIERPYHLGHLEILKSIRTLADEGFSEFGSEFNNGGKPVFSVAAFAKHDLKPGTLIKRAVGSMELRGQVVSIKDNPNHLPIGLLSDCEIQRSIPAGEMLTYADVALPDTLASTAWEFTRELALNVPSSSDSKSIDVKKIK